MTTFNQTTANLSMVEYITSGAYAEHIQSKKNSEAGKEALKEILLSSDEKRHIYDVSGQSIVAKFTKKSVKETNHSGLIEEVLSYIRSEALALAITLDKKKLEADGIDIDDFTRYQYMPTYYFKYTPNKLAKTFNSTMFKVHEDLYGLGEEELVKRIIFNNERGAMLGDYHKNIMKLFYDMPEKSFSTSVGSISKIANKPNWDIFAIIQDYEEEFIQKYGTVKLTELDKFFEIGAIPRSVLSEHQQVIDVRLEFSVMTLEAEQRQQQMFEYIKNKRAKHDLKRVFG